MTDIADPIAPAADPGLLLQALDAADTGLWTWDIATGEVTWTPACYRIFGRPDDGSALTADVFLQAIHPDDRAQVAEQVQASLAVRAPFDCEFRIVRPDGRVRWVVDHGRATFDAQGQARQMLGSVRDITEQKHVERAWRDSQERLRLAVDASGIGLWTWDIASDAVTWSTESYRIHGLQDGEFANTGAAYLALMHPDDRERAQATAAAAIARNRPYECEFRILRPGGEIGWVATRGIARYNEAGQPVSLLGSSVDVTQRKLAELAMQAALEAGRTGTFRWDIRSNTLDWDEALDRLFGLAPGQTVRSLAQFVALVHPDDRQGVIERCDRCRDEGADFEMEFRVVWPDGSVHWLYDRGRTFRDAGGEPAWMTGACVDIDRRKATDTALRESESFYRQVIESIPGMTFTTDAAGRVDYLSDQWEGFLGRPRSALLQEAWPDWLHPEDAERVAQAWRESVGGGPAYDVEYRLRRHDGEYLWFKTRSRAMRDADGKPVRWIGTAVNVHDLKEAQAEARTHQRRLAEADRLKDEFLATLAHELRNPLAPLRTGLEVVRRGAPAADEALGMMERQLRHMVRLVDDLLDVSRISRGVIELQPQRHDVATIVSHAVETCRPTIEARGHALALDLPAQALWVEGDLTRLAQVVGNLLHNAAKYTPAGGRIAVAARRDGEQVEIAVSDNGVGIPAEMQARVFELFVQVEQAREHAQGGLGIGLSLVRKLVELHRGTIAVRSEGIGRGSTFVVRLPMGEAAAQVPPVATDAAAAAAGSRRVLVVDDNVDAADAMTAMLELFGHQARSAHDGPAGLAAARAYRPEVVFLDIGLPRMSGYDVARAFRADPQLAGATLVALTGWGSREDKRRCEEAGFDLHLTKPVDPADVEAALQVRAAGAHPGPA